LLLLDLGPEASDPDVQEEILLGELGRYRPELLERPRVTVGSKGDITDAPSISTRDGEIPVISAVTGQGMPALVSRLGQLVARARKADAAEPVPGFEESPQETGTRQDGESTENTARDAELEAARSGGRPPSPFVHRPLGEAPVEVTRGPDGTFVVGGRSALRAVALSDLTDDEALDLVQFRLRKLGVERALVRAGVRDGDQVQVGDLAFVYHSDDIFTPEVPGSDGRRNRKQPKGQRRGGRSGSKS
jgi:GTP-binding protein